MYTNRRSLEVTYGETEVDQLIQQENARFAKAVAEAAGEIDTYLYSAGYALPLVFDEMADDTPSTLPGRIQKVSDAFTASNLASSEDMQKQKYDLDRAEGIKYLESLLNASLRLTYPASHADFPNAAVARAAGDGMVVTIARPQVFNGSLLPVSRLFTRLPDVDA